MAKKGELKGVSHSRPTRYDAESDMIVKQVMQDRQFNNYNMTVNFVIHQYGIVQADRLAAKDRINKEMIKWGYRGRDFESVTLPKKGKKQPG
jgi:hypothetical protein